ncbi:LysR substrate-binding domain-containing protein [Pseudonocardia sp. NPDC046786]|uniref:LysR substrate-binding domain-containing protein n=1 Tax=Pseudonocardia sp. NPDC046786 TaxID=3155471 RepID=UPI00340EC9C0
MQVPRGPGIAVAADHRLAGHDVVDVAELAGETRVVGTGPAGEPQFGPWPGLERPRTGPEVRHWATRFGLVAAGLGITLVPGLAADSVPHDVRWLPVHDPAGVPDRSLRVVTAPSPSGAAAALVRTVHAEAARLLPR